ncbi:uncharacterized protein LOC142231730 [Haematobia irritans]|uniref:uncharacterized protein LOC142231730 n=1 Tax=Haematobia irritans TaxID=7368 RepID=UPI003F4F5490
MTNLKYICIAVIISSLLVTEFVQGAPVQGHKKSRQQGKSKNGSSLKAPFKKGPNNGQHRNGKMNSYNQRSWPSTSSFYHTPMYLRSSPSTMYYPTRWFSSGNYFSSPTMMPSTTFLRRADDFHSLGTSPTMTPSMMTSLDSGSRTPTLIDLSAFTGGNSLMDNSFGSSNLWALPDTTATASPSKSKFNFFNGFNFNDDGFFGNLFNPFNSIIKLDVDKSCSRKKYFQANDRMLVFRKTGHIAIVPLLSGTPPVICQLCYTKSEKPTAEDGSRITHRFKQQHF